MAAIGTLIALNADLRTGPCGRRRTFRKRRQIDNESTEMGDPVSTRAGLRRQSIIIMIWFRGKLGGSFDVSGPAAEPPRTVLTSFPAEQEI